MIPSWMHALIDASEAAAAGATCEHPEREQDTCPCNDPSEGPERAPRRQVRYTARFAGQLCELTGDPIYQLLTMDATPSPWR